MYLCVLKEGRRAQSAFSLSRKGIVKRENDACYFLENNCKWAKSRYFLLESTIKALGQQRASPTSKSPLALFLRNFNDLSWEAEAGVWWNVANTRAF